MYVCIGCTRMPTSVCMHAWVYEYLTHVCTYMCMCTHAYMHFLAISPPPKKKKKYIYIYIEVCRAGFPPPTPNIEKLPTPMLYTFTINCVTTGTRNMPIGYMFCFICSEKYRIYVRKFSFTATRVRSRKTWFPNAYPTIYLPN